MRAHWLGLIFLCLSPAAILHAAAKPPTDIRVLIDISGSMQENDPKNLRRPALRMLVGLMQPETEAGVWTFARWVNMLVPHGAVDAAWKRQAIARSEEVSSPGQFTNIEEVLDRATRSWRGTPAGSQRHLVLLTDGMVDVSKTPGENEASRERILSALLPEIRATGARVHAVALSDRADHELLRTLAGATDGWYQQVDSAEALQRVFLRIFEKAGRPDAVPLTDNRFQVDRSISEATVLVFRAENAEPTRLFAPDGSRFTGSDIPAGVAWQRDQGYDLITLSDPQPGEWRLEADEDPDNRVMIVTDLKLETSELPNRLAVGEAVSFTAHLSNKGKIIDRRAFLELVEMRAEASGPGGNRALPLNDSGEADDERAGDGRYEMRLASRPVPGSISLLVTAESATFVREKRFVLDIAEPATLAIEREGDGLRALLTPNTGVLADPAVVNLWQETPDGERRLLAARRQPDGRWAAAIAEAELAVRADIEGQTRAGNLVRAELGPVYAPGVTPATVARPVANATIDAQGSAPVAEDASEPAPAPPPALTGEAEESAGWLLPAALLGGLNLLLIGGGVAWWLWRRRQAADGPVIELDIEPIGAAASLGATGATRQEAA